MILIVILILIMLKLSRCSLVLDSLSQNTVYVSNYCPAMKYCNEGTHVMCMYYDHTRANAIGQLCKNYVRITITPLIVQQILKEVNDIRMKVASGKETGKDGIPLPRAYGMMKIYWDSELATLAQVLADQCLGLKEDECRATDRFSNPSQIITLVNFKVPNWEYLSRNTSARGLTKEKVSFAIEKALKSLHAVKRLVNANIVSSCPALEKLPDMSSRSYLKLIRGKATHIGCGISAYTRHQMLDSGSQNTYNTVQIVCNVSDGPEESQPLYTTDPPIPGTGFTEKCGCPHGYRDSVGCLCEKYPHHNIATPAATRKGFDFQPSYDKQQQTAPCEDGSSNCGEKNVFVLPIFEKQDAPTNSYEPDNDIETQFHPRFDNTSFNAASIEDNEISDEVYPEPPSGYPENRENKNGNLEHRKMIPSKSNMQDYDNAAASDEAKPKTFDRGYMSVEDIVAEHHPYPRRNNDYNDKINDNDIYKDNDYTFLTILDHLERALQNIELDGDKREIFDIKMRKIYESALKTKQLSTTTVNTLSTTFKPDEVENEFQELTNYLKHKSKFPVEDDDRVQSEPRSWSKDTNKLNNDIDKDNQYDYMDRKDNESNEFSKGIDDKLIHILNKKNTIARRNNKDDYFNDKNDDGLYDDMDEYTNYPAPRKQEKINKFDKVLKKTMLGKDMLDMQKHKMLRKDNRDSNRFSKKKINNEGHKVNLNAEKEIHTLNVDQSIKTSGRRRFSYPDRNTCRTCKTPGYRRIYETENERPTVPMRQKKDKIKTGSHKGRHHIVNTKIL